MGRIVMILYMLKMWYMVTFVLKKLFLLWRVQKSVVEKYVSFNSMTNFDLYNKLS